MSDNRPAQDSAIISRSHLTELKGNIHAMSCKLQLLWRFVSCFSFDNVSKDEIEGVSNMLGSMFLELERILKKLGELK